MYTGTNQCVSIGYHSAPLLSVLADNDRQFITGNIEFNFSPLIFPVISLFQREHKAVKHQAIFLARVLKKEEERNET